MSQEHLPAGEAPSTLAERARALTEAFVRTDLMRLRIEEPSGDAIEIRRRAVAAPRPPAPGADGMPAQLPPRNLDAVKADLVGIVRFAKPVPAEGDVLDGDRELGFVEALGIRNPVRSRGAGRIVTIAVRDGQPVEYAQTLFEIDRA